jgi:hypothetical protein
VNAPIRLPSVLLLVSLSLLSAACATGTQAGAPAQRLVREPLVQDDGPPRSVGTPSVQQAHAPEPPRSGGVLSVSAARRPWRDPGP